jgi:23S rRNA (guanine2445-N2)-methyltransferase / 23S rRNA (guanine2069-N7)-methyltransferase
MSKTEMLANRVKKNARHLAKWAKRENVTCWRVYDRDIPELPITIDTYEGALVINDYRHVDEAGERGGGDAWLEEMTSTARTALDAPEAFVKQRVWRTVREGGYAFRVNLGGYVDTGLFLDHRITRAKAAAEPAKTMLNLFAYTGSFSVYCAAAGMQTTTVDLSKTYLDWAGENLALNRLDGEIVHSDVREFLQTERRWDLAVVDPPTFSNSKRMDYTWDVQRDHASLLDDVARVANVIWFSTNRRRFKLEWSRPGWTVADHTHATIPPDFRDGRAHHAFRLARG